MTPEQYNSILKSLHLSTLELIEIHATKTSKNVKNIKNLSLNLPMPNVKKKRDKIEYEVKFEISGYNKNEDAPTVKVILVYFLEFDVNTEIVYDDEVWDMFHKRFLETTISLMLWPEIRHELLNISHKMNLSPILLDLLIQDFKGNDEE
jgi:hypothetical protein